MFLSWNRIALLFLFLHIASASVICGGGHTAATCADCPINEDERMGEGWCNGECEWTADNECVHKLVSASCWGSELRHEDTYCVGESASYGDFPSPEQCAMVAGEDGCGSFSMFNSDYIRTCRCCSNPFSFYVAEQSDIYDVVDCTPTMEPSNPPTVAPITSPIPVVNKGFEDGSTKWKLTDKVSRVCNSWNEDDDSCAMMFKGNRKNKKQSIIQVIRKLDLKPEYSLFLSFWVKGENMKKFKSNITLRDKKNKVGKFNCKVNKKGTFEYYMMECKYDVTKICNNLLLKFESKAGKVKNKVFLDDVKLSHSINIDK